MTSIIDEIHKILPQVSGMPCWRVDACVIGSTLSMCFGKTLFSKGAVSGRVSAEGEVQLLLWCDWRLDSIDDAICRVACTEEQIVSGTKQLIGQSLQTIEIFPPVWDAVITFSSNMKLKVFCSEIFAEYPATNWDFCFGRCSYFFGCGKQISKEDRIGLCDEDFLNKKAEEM